MSEKYSMYEKQIRDICVGPATMDEPTFDRFLAGIKADALREAADRAEEPLGSEEQDGDTDPYFHGARYGVRRVADWMRVRADRIEEEA